MSMSFCTEGSTVPMCGDSKVAEKWINGKAKIGHTGKTLHSWWRRKVAYPVGRIDDYVKHILREHNLEADHLANLGADGQRKITVEKGDNTENWKAV